MANDTNPCKVEKSDYVNRYGKIFFGAEETKKSIDFQIYSPAYIPFSIKQVCPINSQMVQAGFRVIGITFYENSLQEDAVRGFENLISNYQDKEVLFVREEKKQADRSIEKILGLTSDVWNYEEIKIGNFHASLATYKSEALKMRSYFKPNRKILNFFIDDTEISLTSDVLPKEELIKIAESLKPL